MKKARSIEHDREEIAARWPAAAQCGKISNSLAQNQVLVMQGLLRSQMEVNFLCKSFSDFVASYYRICFYPTVYHGVTPVAKSIRSHDLYSAGSASSSAADISGTRDLNEAQSA